MLEHTLTPRTGGGEGCHDVPSGEAKRGFEEFNRGDYFQQHEMLEAAWRAEQRPVRELYQGILQIGLACYQIERENWIGAVKMLRRGLPRLARLPDVCQGVRVSPLSAAAEAMLAELLRLGPERVSLFDRCRFPVVCYHQELK